MCNLNFLNYIKLIKILHIILLMACNMHVCYYKTDGELSDCTAQCKHDLLLTV
jgi:hypothetical protein